MKISRIILNDFRGFPGPADYKFNLDGRNLLLFGENGSGKSSIFVALREFFNRAAHPPAFEKFRNVFTADPAGLPLTSGKVSVEFDNGGGQHTWDIATDTRPLTAPVVADASLRFGLVDYRAMLKTSFVHANGYPNLFDLLVNGVLDRMPVTDDQGRQTTLGRIAQNMRDLKPRYNYARPLRAVDAACLTLSRVLLNQLPLLAAAANEILTVFGDIGVRFQLVPPPLPVTPAPNPAPANPPHLRFDRNTRDFANLKIDFVTQLYGHGPDEPQHFLNEARLSAVALSIYLAAIKISIPSAPLGSNPAKVLVLDDVLIGLDMSNRQPLLNILTRADQPGQPGFADWQVILMTHDQAWHTLARKQINRADWKAARLATGFNGSRDFPILYDDTSLIDRAEKYLNQHGDERAAGLYLRLAFEEILKGFCLRTKQMVVYHLPDSPPNTQAFWQPICAVKIGSRFLVDPGLKRNVESCRRNVANPLCHNGNNPPLRAEVITAIAVLRRLQTVLDTYPSANLKSPVPPRPILDLAIEVCSAAANFSPWDAAVLLRSAFDDSLSRLAAKKCVTVRYDTHFSEFEGQRLWQALTQPPVNLRTVRSAEVGNIQTHSAIFLMALDQAVLIAQPQAFFQAALHALLAPPPTAPTPPPLPAATTWLDGVP